MKVVIVDGEQYSIDKMDAIKQFQVVRRLTPVLAALFKSIDVDEKPETENAEQMAKEVIHGFLSNAGPLADALAGMSDEQVENIIYPCMAVVKRAQGPAWAPIKAPGQNKLMFADINGMTLVKLTIEVLKENFANFFSGVLSAQPGSPPPTA